VTHFELFGLVPSVDVDVSALEAKHRALQLELHPDRQADPKARRMAVDQTASLNEAIKVLRDPVKRAFYLLKLKGVDLERDEAGEQRQMPIEFLEEVMERREALEEVKAAKDVAKAQAMAVEVTALKAQALETARKALTADEVKEATHQLGRVRYFTRFLEEVEAIEEEALAS
jgi:molecular chaperone HscB